MPRSRHLIIRRPQDAAALQREIRANERQMGRSIGMRRSFNCMLQMLRAGGESGAYNTVGCPQDTETCARVLHPEFMNDNPRHPRAADYARVRLAALKEYRRWFELQQNSELTGVMCTLSYVKLDLLHIETNTTEKKQARTVDEVQGLIDLIQTMDTKTTSCTGITGYIDKFDKDGFDVIVEHNDAFKAQLCTQWQTCIQTFFNQGWSAMDNKLENVLAKVEFLRVSKVVLTDFDGIVKADPTRKDLDPDGTVSSTFCISCDQCELCKTRRKTPSGMRGGCVMLTPWLGYLIGCYMAAYQVRPLPNCALMRGRPDWDHFQFGDDAFLTWRGGSSTGSFADTPVAEQYIRLDDFCTELLQQQTESQSSVTYGKFTSKAGPAMTAVLRNAAQVVQGKLHEHVGGTEKIKAIRENAQAAASRKRPLGATDPDENDPGRQQRGNKIPRPRSRTL